MYRHISCGAQSSAAATLPRPDRHVPRIDFPVYLGRAGRTPPRTGLRDLIHLPRNMRNCSGRRTLKYVIITSVRRMLPSAPLS